MAATGQQDTNKILLVPEFKLHEPNTPVVGWLSQIPSIKESGWIVGES